MLTEQEARSQEAWLGAVARSKVRKFRVLAFALPVEAGLQEF